MLNPHIKVCPPRSKKMVYSGTFLTDPGLKTNAQLAQLTRPNFKDSQVIENNTKYMLAKRTAVTMSNILAPSVEFQQISSGFSKLETMARHIPATYESEYHLQTYLQPPLSKDVLRVKAARPFHSKTNTPEQGQRLDKKHEKKRRNTAIVQAVGSCEDTADQSAITLQDSIVSDNLKLLQVDGKFPSRKLLEEKLGGSDSTNSGSGNSLKQTRNFDFLKKRKERGQQTGVGGVIFKQFQALQPQKNADIVWPLSMSPIEQKVSQKQNLEQPATVPAVKQEGNPKDMDQNIQFKKKPTFLSQKLKPKQESLPLRGKRTKPMRDITIADFQILDKLGKGSLGEVYVAVEKTSGFICVIKKMSKQRIQEAGAMEHVIREIKIQSYLNHSQLTSLYGYFHDQDNLYLILELLPDGSLMQVKKRRKLAERQAVQIVKQVAQGLKYMHEECIIHRDLKPENLFTNEGYIKIGDFGCSVYNNLPVLRKTVVGSMEYFAPEQLCKQGYGEKVDCWSLGILTYELLYGRSPFVDDIRNIVLSNELKPELSEVYFPETPVISQQCRQFISKLLKTNPEHRLSMEAVLAHPFLRGDQKMQKQNI